MANSVSNMKISYDPKYFKPIDILKCALKNSGKTYDIEPTNEIESMFPEMTFQNVQRTQSHSSAGVGGRHGMKHLL